MTGVVCSCMNPALDALSKPSQRTYVWNEKDGKDGEAAAARRVSRS